MRTIGMVWGVAWRSVLVGIGYILALLAGGLVGSILPGATLNRPVSGSVFAWLFISGVLAGLFVGPVAARMHVTRWRHICVWASVLFFNTGAVVIEGAFFAPELVSIPLPALLAQQLLTAAAVAVLITFLFSVPATSTSLAVILRARPWHSWVWRFAVSSLSYILFYFTFGALNYSLVTGPYYAEHTGGLTVPPPESVLMVEAIRAPLIVLSIGLFVLSSRFTRQSLALTTGFMLFWLGGLVPLLLQVTALPLPLLAASGAEIFLQNFLTGVVAALLLQVSE